MMRRNCSRTSWSCRTYTWADHSKRDAQLVRDRHPRQIRLRDRHGLHPADGQDRHMPGHGAPVDHAGDPQGGGEGFRRPGHLIQQAGEIPRTPLGHVQLAAELRGGEPEVGGAVQQPRHLPGRHRPAAHPGPGHQRVQRGQLRLLRVEFAGQWSPRPAATPPQRVGRAGSGAGSRHRGRPVSRPGAHPRNWRCSPASRSGQHGNGTAPNAACRSVTSR